MDEKDDDIQVIQGAQGSWLVLDSDSKELERIKKGDFESLRRVRLIEADLAGVDFSGKELTSIDFTQANLPGAKFKNAKLVNLKLTNANLTGANLDDTDFFPEGDNRKKSPLIGACLENADFSHTRISPVQLNQARSLYRTQLPVAGYWVYISSTSKSALREDPPEPTFVKDNDEWYIFGNSKKTGKTEYTKLSQEVAAKLDKVVKEKKDHIWVEGGKGDGAYKTLYDEIELKGAHHSGFSPVNYREALGVTLLENKVVLGYTEGILRDSKFGDEKDKVLLALQLLRAEESPLRWGHLEDFNDRFQKKLDLVKSFNEPSNFIMESMKQELQKIVSEWWEKSSYKNKRVLGAEKEGGNILKFFYSRSERTEQISRLNELLKEQEAPKFFETLFEIKNQVKSENNFWPSALLRQIDGVLASVNNSPSMSNTNQL